MTGEPDETRSSTPEEIEAEYYELLGRLSRWQFELGRLRIRADFNSQRFARYFVGFHLTIFVAGGGLIFFGGSLRDLGMALVVGSLFSFGAFLAQVWGLQASREHSLFEEHIQKQYAELNERWERANNEREQRRAGGSVT